MRLSILSLVTCVGLSVLFCSVALAAPGPIAASTTLNVATDISATVSQIDSKGTATPTDDTWAAAPGGTLSFGTLSLKTGVDPQGRTWSVFLPQYYFAIDVGFPDGGMPTSKSIGVTYGSDVRPAGATKGLGDKATITYCKTYFAAPGDWALKKTTDSVIEKKLLKDGNTIVTSAIAGGWLRMYVGIVTLDPAAVPLDPAGADIFSPSDITGTYSGTITISLI
jgi:hypothetical protein